MTKTNNKKTPALYHEGGTDGRQQFMEESNGFPLMPLLVSLVGAVTVGLVIVGAAIFITKII